MANVIGGGYGEGAHLERFEHLFNFANGAQTGAPYRHEIVFQIVDEAVALLCKCAGERRGLQAVERIGGQWAADEDIDPQRIRLGWRRPRVSRGDAAQQFVAQENRAGMAVLQGADIYCAWIGCFERSLQARPVETGRNSLMPGLGACVPILGGSILLKGYFPVFEVQSSHVQ